MDGEIHAEELRDLIDADADVRIVDIRSPGAFAQGHIPGSENIPFAELPQRVEALDGANRVVTVCPIGQSSIQAARLIGSYEGANGATVESLAGGIDGWEYGFEADDGGSDDTDEGPANEGPEAPF
ncbi:rhodanese-like domain-containing protein [Halomarina oriensis]|uniref:Rhodanese-like domain-containing protein n=1 Tax=Halomarina oriensis TaxID=671145 RepID=A0A6B0GXZ0_9EURY|nr:rhodanese-like domain-containing protein [Halomarina oriensis]MWG36648.1 rhodanese-like domain-containing protein [Halomarina oriensis]